MPRPLHFMRITRIIEWQEGKAMDHSSAKAEQTIRQAGWYYVYTKGDHRDFKHATKPGKVTIPANRKDLNIKTWNSIMRQAGLK